MNDLEKPPPELAKAYYELKICRVLLVLLFASSHPTKLLTYTPNRQWDEFHVPFFHPIPKTNTLHPQLTFWQQVDRANRIARILNKINYRKAQGIPCPIF